MTTQHFTITVNEDSTAEGLASVSFLRGRWALKAAIDFLRAQPDAWSYRVTEWDASDVDAYGCPECLGTVTGDDFLHDGGAV